MARFLWILVAASARLLADGGMVVLHEQSPPFVITVFAAPSPPRAGVIDLSILVQSSDTLEPVPDAEVHFEFTKDGSQVQARATRDQTQNRLLHAVPVHLDDPGEWNYTVSIRTARSASVPVTMSGMIAVAPEQSKLVAYWSYLALPFLWMAIFAVHQWLRWGDRHTRQQDLHAERRVSLGAAMGGTHDLFGDRAPECSKR